MQQRYSSHGSASDIEIGPPASFNQLPQPEGDWAENHNKKQQKYNGILAASALFFVGTFAFVSLPQLFYHEANSILQTIDSLCIKCISIAKF